MGVAAAAPTGRSVAWTEMHFCRVIAGRLVEHWPVIDQLSLLRQLGALAAPEQASGVPEAV